MKMKINKEENVLITGYNGGPVTTKADFKIITQKEWALTEERLHENCIINIYAISSYN